MSKRSPNEASRAFSVGGWIVLSPAERAEREAQIRRAAPAREKPKHLDYQGTELHRNPGIPASRFQAFELPSRANDLLFYPDGRVEPFPEAQTSSPPAR